MGRWRETWPSWDPADLVSWIMSLDNGHFNQWRSQIAQKVTELKLNGRGLGKVNDLVLKSFGISDDSVRSLLEHIQELTGQATAGDDDENDDDSCVVCMSAERTHICVPCGHKCCCENCQDKFKDHCPICRKPLQMVIKIF
eukprot:TRINITY_DN2918_c0_g1_i1.p1 TRINITY_DN2918_c0_g1~~TRINITY_DN2918_c0_g1_i1.p1  ORF type:complete len:141 (-),score=20.95 TRINITY_DN2918_c0_g1_i1:76-498(-)